jgi:hypothetical protein
VPRTDPQIPVNPALALMIDPDGPVPAALSPTLISRRSVQVQFHSCDAAHRRTHRRRITQALQKTPAVLQALNKVGGPLGSAVLGSVLASAYVARLDLAALPAAAATAVRQSVFGGDAVAHTLRSSTLTQAVHLAFVHGMDASLSVSAGIAFAGILRSASQRTTYSRATHDGPAPVQPSGDAGDRAER